MHISGTTLSRHWCPMSFVHAMQHVFTTFLLGMYISDIMPNQRHVYYYFQHHCLKNILKLTCCGYNDMDIYFSNDSVRKNFYK
jgi:hypothetical protein